MTDVSEPALLAVEELADRHDLAAERAGEESRGLVEQSRELADRARHLAGEADTLRRRAAEIRDMVARERQAIAQAQPVALVVPRSHSRCRNCGGPLVLDETRQWEHLLPGGGCDRPMGPREPDPTSTLVDGMPVAGRTPPPASAGPEETGGAL